MTRKKLMALAIGGMMALNLAGIMIPDIAGTAEAAIQRHEDRIRPNDEFNRAVRKEHERHEKKVHEIKKKYRSHSQMDKLHSEMSKEKGRHEAALREINRKYHHPRPRF